MQISLRKFECADIPLKVKWINDPLNNKYLHYEFPLEEEKTKAWFETAQKDPCRFDGIIECDGAPCGLIGLLNIDRKNRKAEYYIAMGEQAFKGKEIAFEASKRLFDYAFSDLGLSRIYMFTETENIPAQKLFEKLGCIREGLLRGDLFTRGRYIDRYIYGITQKQ